jgi:hypothetical protein
LAPESDLNGLGKRPADRSRKELVNLARQIEAQE